MPAPLASDPSDLCIFCGGLRTATSDEHCPPRALFRDKAWPVGYVFRACDECNGGTSNDDLMVAWVAQLDVDGDQKSLQKGTGLMKAVHRQFPGTLSKMFELSPIEARKLARRLGLKPQPGQTYQEIGIAPIPEEMQMAVQTLAGKLTKAVFFKETGQIFRAEGCILFQWFTNAQLREHGRIFVLDAFDAISGKTNPKTRNGKDLADQFDYEYSVDETAELHLLKVIFGKVFGFVSIFSQVPGRLETIEAGIAANNPVKRSPFVKLQ